jgi:hypothetical protein
VSLKKDFDDQALWLDTYGPRYIYVDNPESRIGRELYLRLGQIQRVLNKTMNYEKLENNNEFFILYIRK